MHEEPLRSFEELKLPFPPPVEEPWSRMLTPKQIDRLVLEGLAAIYRAITQSAEEAVITGQAVTGSKWNIRSAPINIEESGENLIIPINALPIKVIAFAIQSPGVGPVDVQFMGKKDDNSTELTGLFTFGEREGVSGGTAAPSFLFSTEAGSSLMIDISIATAVVGYISYFTDEPTQ